MHRIYNDHTADVEIRQARELRPSSGVPLDKVIARTLRGAPSVLLHEAYMLIMRTRSESYVCHQYRRMIGIRDADRPPAVNAAGDAFSDCLIQQRVQKNV